MKNSSTLERYWIAFDYGYLLPFFSRLPPDLGRKLASIRGAIYARLGRDWRQFTFGDDALFQRTRKAFLELMPNIKDKELSALIRERCVMQSLEELEACWLARKDLIDWPVEYVGLEKAAKAAETHGRLVFVTAHYSSCVLGIALLRRLGLPILAMTSNVTEDQRVHPAIKQFYRNRKTAGNRYLLGGQVLDREGNTRTFVKFIKRGGIVIIFGELPPAPSEESVTVSFLGKERELTAGPTRLATIGDAPLLSYVCEYTPKGFRVTFSDPAENPYALIEHHILENPSAWWAADVLPTFTAKEAE